MKKFLKRSFWSLVFSFAIMSAFVLYAHPDWLVVPPSFLPKASALSKAGAGDCAGYPDGICESCTIGQCGGKDATPPDPNRPYFDGYGNQFDYLGNVLHTNCPYTDPINHTPNPYCQTEKGVTEDVSSSSDNSGFGK